MPYKDADRQREYARKWMAARRQSYMCDKVCVVCGSTDRLELDHIERKSKVSHCIWSWSERRRVEELAKCQVLCFSHHQEKTRVELHFLFQQGPLHGLTMPMRLGVDVRSVGRISAST